MKSQDPDIYLKELQELIKLTIQIIREHSALFEITEQSLRTESFFSHEPFKEFFKGLVAKIEYNEVHNYIRFSKSIEYEDVNHYALMVTCCTIHALTTGYSMDRVARFMNRCDVERYVETDVFKVGVVPRIRLAGISMHMDIGQRYQRLKFYPSNADPRRFS